MTIVRIEALYLGRQFTQADANSGIDTNPRVIIYDNFPRFFARAWDDGGRGEDIWFEIHLFQRTGAVPPYVYNPLVAFSVNSRDTYQLFYEKQFYKTGEVCVVNFSLDPDSSLDLDSYAGASNIFAIQWIAYDATTDTPLATSLIEFTYIPESRLCNLEKVDFMAFDRITIFRPDDADPANWRG